MSSIAITFIVLAVCLISSVPIAVSLGICSAVGIWLMDIPISMFTQRLYSTFNSIPLLAVPFFLLSGDIMLHGTLSKSLLDMCRTTAGHIRGGLGHISFVTCLFYGALCGSSAACTAAVGGTMIPAMEEEGYPKDFAVAVNTTGGLLANFIPPSVGLILAGSIGGVSIADLFIGSIVPGLLACALWLAVVYYYARTRGYGIIHPKQGWKSRLEGMWKAKLALGMPIVILGLIYTGVATPTEAGAAACVYGFIVETFITKSLNWQKFKKICISTIYTTGMVIFIVISANALGVVISTFQVTDKLLHLLTSIAPNQAALIFILLIFYLIVGCFLEGAAIILIVTPILVPIALSYGFDPRHFLIFQGMAVAVGLITPPVGTNLFVGCTIGDIGLVQLSKATLPFILALIVAVIITGFVPWLSLCLL